MSLYNNERLSKTFEIPGFPGYTFNAQGEIFKDGKYKVVSCKAGRSAKVIIRVNKKMYTLGLATLVAEQFVPNPRKYKYIIFRDRDHHNCDSKNLAWVDADTYFEYCCPRTKRGKSKIVVDRQEAIRKAKDINLKQYYVTLDEYWIQEAWKGIDKEMSEFSFWESVMSEVYCQFVDRVKRFSILGNPVGLMWYYAKGEFIKLKKEISPNLPYKKLVSTDETLRNIRRNMLDN